MNSKNNETAIIKREALKLLAMRDYTQHQLTKKLLRKKFARENIQETLDTLDRDNWLNDKRFVENFVIRRTNAGYGPLRIQMELRNAGIDAETINTFLNFSAEEWFELAEKVFTRKFGNIQVNTAHIKEKQIRFLQHRGFIQKQIEHALHLKI